MNTSVLTQGAKVRTEILNNIYTPFRFRSCQDQSLINTTSSAGREEVILLSYENEHLQEVHKQHCFLIFGWRNWFRHCAANWKVAGSIADGVIGIFRLLNSFDRTTTLKSTHPLTE